MDNRLTERDSIEIRRLADCTFRQAVELWNQGFSGYYSDMSTTLEKFTARLGRESIRTDLSVAAFVNGEPAGFVLIALKEAGGVKIAWNGGTGVSPNQRGKGLAKLLMREAAEAIKESGASIAYLEVVQKNAGAIAAYESAGFRKCDGLIGAKLEGPLPASAVQADEAYRVRPAKLRELTALPFFRHDSAWNCQWFNRSDSEGIAVIDEQGAIGSYAIVRRSYGENGELAGAVLFHCAADPERPDRNRLARAAVAGAFGPADAACTRTTDNLSMSDPAVTEWLEEAGFKTIYTQYLMVADFSA
ncbi:GNAT family N-acetyltransferase [Paenibacillus sp. GYB004]|uniref:GNAT family N-acetyltransferase n=1 Tax=Paenibacillus sp. GYB004 TaxID=2994393 RepID=UPI002F963E3F